MRFSIIIPIYKVEDYLPQCIESILVQTYKDYEIILVDDGSPDGCHQICDDYSIKYNSIQVIHKQNGGLSFERNAGLYEDKGDYIILLESDDYCDDSNALLWVSNQIDTYRNDVIMWGVKIMDVSKNHICLSKSNIKPYNLSFVNKHSAACVIKHLESHEQYPGSAWVLTTKRSLIIENNIYFVEGNLGEDYDWVTKILFKAQSIGCINRNFYVYRTNRSGSITNLKIEPAQMRGMIDAITNWLKIYNIQYIGITRNLAKVYLIALKGFYELTEEEQCRCIEECKKICKILKLSRKVVYVSMYYLLCIVGVKAMSQIIHLTYDLKKSLNGLFSYNPK